VDERCQFCTERNLDCDKIFGPFRTLKKKLATGPRSLTIASVTTLATSVPRELSLINDSDFSPLELHAYRSDYFRLISDYNLQGPEPIVLRYLWNVRGLTFSNDALRSAVLANFLWRMGDGRAAESRLSRFRRSMMKSLEAGKVSKDHLFGIFFLCNAQMTDNTWVHTLGFEAVLRHLIHHLSPIDDASGPICLVDMLGYMVSIVQTSTLDLNELSEPAAYRLITTLGDLVRGLQHPSRSFALHLESAFLSSSFPNRPKTELLGGVLSALHDIQVHLFLFVHQTVCSQPNAEGELHLAEEMLRTFECATTVKETLKMVQSSLSHFLTISLDVKMSFGMDLTRSFWRAFVFATLRFVAEFACIDV